MPKGHIEFVNMNEGFGCIIDERSRKIYFDAHEVKAPFKMNDLDEGDFVEYEKKSQGRDKPPRAISIWLIQTANDQTKYRFLNPYNFVQFLPQGKNGSDDLSVSLLGCCAPPPHDRYVGLSGQMTCRLTTESPFFISDAEGVCEGEKEHKTYQFFRVNNTLAVPGSSLRGMVRSLFEAATNSCMAVFQFDKRDGKDYPLEFRAGRAPELFPARVVELNQNGCKLEVLDCSKKSPVPFSHPPAPIKTGAVYAYHRRVLGRQRQDNKFVEIPFSLSRLLPANSTNGMRVAILVNLQPIIKSRYQFFTIEKIVKADNYTNLVPQANQKRLFGYLYLTGPNIENKHDERVFFRWDDDQSLESPSLGNIPDEYIIDADLDVVEEYNYRLADYWERNKQTVSKLGVQPWPRKPESLPHPSNFISSGRKLQNNDLVYFTKDHNGKVALLRPVSMPRIPYKNTRETYLPEGLQTGGGCEKETGNFAELVLCPACRLFGWVQQDTAKHHSAERVAYAGRVKFSHANLQNKPKTLQQTIPLAILSSPKPTTTSFYLAKKEGDHIKACFDVDYDDKGENAQLRGRKFYRHHGSKLKPQEYMRPKKNGEYNRDGQNRSVKDVLDRGNMFEFTVQFENLAPVELGALLWSLEMEDGMYHRLGYAKPLGFGSVYVDIKNLEIINPAERYDSLLWNGLRPISEDDKGELVQLFKDAMKAKYVTEFDMLGNIRDLQILLSEPEECNNIHYPRPPRRQQHLLERTKPEPEGKQFEWFVGNKKAEQFLPLAQEDLEGFVLIDRDGNTEFE